MYKYLHFYYGCLNPHSHSYTHIHTPTHTFTLPHTHSHSHTHIHTLTHTLSDTYTTHHISTSRERDRWIDAVHITREEMLRRCDSLLQPENIIDEALYNYRAEVTQVILFPPIPYSYLLFPSIRASSLLFPPLPTSSRLEYTVNYLQ